MDALFVVLQVRYQMEHTRFARVQYVDHIQMVGDLVDHFSEKKTTTLNYCDKIMNQKWRGKSHRHSESSLILVNSVSTYFSVHCSENL